MATSDIAAPTKGAGIMGLVDAVRSVGDVQLAYSAFRITLGMNIFFHGAMRLITGLDAWVTMQASVFTKQPILPMWSVVAFLYVLPFVEVVLGALTFIGLYTRWALIAGSV